jgi:hypothetical protein
MYLLIERLGSNRTNGARCWLERWMLRIIL